MNFFPRKPREIGQLRTEYSPPPELKQLLQTVDDMTERLKADDEPPPVKINRLAEIAYHLRMLTWSEMVELAQATSSDAAVLHKWADSYGEHDR